MADWERRLIQPRPESERVRLQRHPQAGVVCESCGGSDVARYPVANHQGPWIMTRCQDCLHIVQVERPGLQDAWPPFRAVAYDWEASPAERRSRDELERR